MSRKNTLVTSIATGQSLAASFNSTPTMVQYMDNCSYQIVITTSDSQGSFTVQASNDYSPADPSGASPQNTGTWNDLPIGGTPVVAATNDTILIDLNQLPFKAIRLAYTSTTPGTGTCSIKISFKTVGA